MEENEYRNFVLLFSAKCIDYYTQQRIAEAENTKDAKEIDPRLEAIVNRMFQRCLDDGQYRQALGLALETRRMDIFEKAIVESVSSFK
jgi:26S proteasome regulatory subunit N2